MELTQQFNELIGRAERPTQDELTAVFDDADPVDIDLLRGEWDGHMFGEDAPEEQLLMSIRWVGKAFRAADDVDPIVCLDETGERVANPVAGSAHVEMVPYRGAETATMVYDSQPMRDPSLSTPSQPPDRIDDKTLLGVMVKDDLSEPGYFYLTRR